MTKDKAIKILAGVSIGLVVMVEPLHIKINHINKVL